MIQHFFRSVAVFIALVLSIHAHSQDTLILIRHAEKPQKGDNLNCKGLNRSMQLPHVLTSKFRIPSNIFVPKLKTGAETKHSRMFQTVTPLAAQFNLHINTSHDKSDSIGVAKDLRTKKGITLLVWEHHNIPPIARALGVKNVPEWSDDDYDSIWIITDAGKKTAKLTVDHEGLNNLSENCQ